MHEIHSEIGSGVYYNGRIDFFLFISSLITNYFFLYREVLQQSLAITLDILLGAGVALPHWNEEPIRL